MIQHQNSLKILGMTLTPDMKFEKHMTTGTTNICKSIRYKATILKAAKPFLPLKALATTGNNLINSTIMYGAPIWGSASRAQINKVQTAQTKVARMITGTTWGVEKFTHRQVILDRIEWPNVDQLIMMATANLVRQAGQNMSSEGMNKMIKKKVQTSQRRGPAMQLRHNGLLKRKNNTFSSTATEQFNKLPITLRDPSLKPSQFKTQLKEFALTTQLLKEH